MNDIQWWTPQTRPAYVLWTEDGGVENGPLLGADEVICDVCNADVLVTPVPVVAGNALCAVCFREMCCMTVEEAARQDGVAIKMLEKNMEGE